MKKGAKKVWFKVPKSFRRPIALFVGFSLIILAGLIGWLPGPGGIPLFILGIAILASEYEWADRLKRFILDIIKKITEWNRNNKLLGSVLLVICATFAIFSSYFIYSKIL